MKNMECWIRVVVSMWVLLNGLGWTHGCVDQEREALLQLKPFFYTLNWPESSNSSECCEWERVECNATTGRVTKLSLSTIARETWHLNVSYFLPFEQLTSLDLSGNYVQGREGNQGFEILWSRLRKLEVLDLRANNFNESIISSLSGFASLKSLYLNENKMGTTSDTTGFESLWKLRNLELLDLSINYYNNSILSSLRGLSSLKDLNLAENQLSGTINAQDLNNILNLKRLDMHLNEITGFESFKGDLEFLDLMGNRFNNSVFASLNGLSHLKSLNLSENQLTGSIHLEELASLSNLEELTISGNSNIEEIMGPEDKTTLNKLKVLGLAFLQTNGKGSVLKSLGPLSALKTIDLRGNILNETNTFEELFNLSTLENLFLDESIIHKDFLQNHVAACTSLKVLHLSRCGLKGTLPNRGWCELKNLEELDLGDNEFEGALPSCMANMSSLHTLRLTRNQFTGNLASGPIPKLKSIESLLLGYNHFQVSLESFANHSSLKNLMANDNELIEEVASYSWTPKLQLEVLSLSHCRPKTPKASSLNFLYHQFNLGYLDLSGSKFGGAFPSWLFENNTRLEQIYLGDNSFVGSFQLPLHPNLNVSVIDVSYNKLGGHIPSNLSFIFPNLLLFNISMNSFQGIIPPSLGNINSLEFMDLSNNQLSGEIKEQFANTPLQLIKLSNNNFSGRIPDLFDPIRLHVLLLGGNNFVGEIPDLSSFIYLMTLDISSNSLSGMLPSWIANMSDLRIISLSGNQFEGSIPLEFCKLYELQFLGLSSNDLSGSIPPCFSELTNLEYVLLSRNKFGGPIPHALINVTGLRNLDLGGNNFSGTIPNWIGNFSSLTILLLQANNLHGNIPIELCQLKQLNILALSSNNLSGRLHACLSNLSSITPSRVSIQAYLKISYINSLPNFEDSTSDFGHLIFPIQEALELATKGNSLSYIGFNLDHMYAIDLSCNRFFGEIPPEFGNLSNVRALNLSHNNLSGSIPASFSKLKQLESLDLSYNDLSGQIPPQLTEIYTLAVFSVAHNDLSGPVPDFKAQFGTFNESCYEGNPLLCGPPMNNSCDETHFAPPPLKEESEDDGFMDMTFFWVTFVVTYTVALFGVASVLYINSNWRHAWFYRIDVCFHTCYYFLLDRFQ
ncbi:receptor-like protein 15 isoform X1 [Tripterygium wilfordii]|uniref:receptor-like protein 15 isoform X1 n=1 Tax=Tripterygium wilfordii TaxID=458696 RepID=UPI0018F84868|nr:receptor-like protein 15 isoform X1 [Tripterygium wilfordii]